MIKKIRHFIEISIKIIIVYTNYIIIIKLIKQNNFNITLIKKFNLHFIKISKYLQRFRLKIKYKFDKINIVLNVLSKLANCFLNSFENFILDVIDFFLINVILINEFFRKRLLKNY